MTRQAKHKKRQNRADRSISKSAARPAQSGLQAEILNLQRSAGNKVVSQLLQNEANEKHHVNVASPLVDSTLNGEGQPLDASSRSHMEALFNEDFSGVRVHTDAEAAESAQEVEARAYTSGEDVVFGANQYRPDTGEGKQLIAHELAHTIQHRDAGQSASPGAGASISRAPLGSKEPEPLSLFGSQIPAPEVSRMGNMLVATVYFGQDFFLLDSRNLAAVEKLGEELKFVMEPSIAVNGYASTEGKEGHNQKLSENRRSAVITILQSKISGPATFTGKGHGSTEAAVEETGKKGKELDSQRARNRRVTIVATLPAASAAAPAEEEKKKKPFVPAPRIEWRPETPRELGERMMREAKEAERIRKEREAQKGGRSLNEWFYEKVDDSVEKAAKKLGVPDKYIPFIQKGARAAIEKGTEALLDEALDQTPLSDEGKEALKSAIEAAGKTKPQ